MSNRANLDALSFLDLPTELRLSIYEIHFQHPSPLLLLATPSGKLHIYSHLNDQNHNLTTHSRQPNTSILPEALTRAHQPHLHFLLVSHQIHHEAASTFYSNTFHILRGTHAYLSFHDTTGRYMNETSARWLRNIGQHLSFVRKLEIDIGNVCTLGCTCVEKTRGPTFRKEDGYLHLGDLVQAVWRSGSKMVVEFTEQDVTADTTNFAQDEATPAHSACDSHRLTQVVQALCQDTLGMKTFRRAIGDVGIKADGSGGVFVFRTPSWQENMMTVQVSQIGEPNLLLDHARYFDAQGDGTMCFAERKLRSLLDISRGVLTNVVEYAVDSKRPCEIDLDSFVDFSDFFGILYVDMGIHDRHIGTVLREHTFELSMMNTNLRAEFDFGKLERLLKTIFEPNSTVGEMRSRVCFGTDVDYTINLHIHSGTSLLEDVRINAIPLLVATFASNGTQLIDIHVHKANGIVETIAMSIRRIRQDVLKVLEQYVKKDRAIDAWVRCPEIWINGHGEVVDVVGTGSLKGDGLVDPAKTDRVLWSALETGYVGAKAPEVHDADGLARGMYLYLKWKSV